MVSYVVQQRGFPAEGFIANWTTAFLSLQNFVVHSLQSCFQVEGNDLLFLRRLLPTVWRTTEQRRAGGHHSGARIVVEIRHHPFGYAFNVIIS